jgi:hypothetical protein
MLRLVVFGWAAAWPLLAQFESLSTTKDGSVLFFTTTLIQAGTDQPHHGKVFIVDGNGVRPFLITQREWWSGLSPLTPSYSYSNYYSYHGVDIASSGSGIAYSAGWECSMTAGLCGYRDGLTVYDYKGQQIYFQRGSGILSPNGEWALITRKSLSNGPEQHLVVHIPSRREFRLSAQRQVIRTNFRDHDIADNGTAVIITDDRTAQDQPRLAVFRPPDTTVFLPVRPPVAVIDATGSTIFTGSHVARLIGDTWQLSTFPLTARSPQISDDGSLVGFIWSGGQFYTSRSDGSDRRRLTSEPEGIRKAVMSGDGRVVWALTNTGRIVRTDIESGSTQITGPVPVFDDFGLNRLVIGNMYRLPATVGKNQEVQLELDGRLLPVGWVEDGAVGIQIPWDLQTDVDHKLGLRLLHDNEWIGGTLIRRVSEFSPAFVRYEGTPAKPGDVITLSATGLGRVSPAVPYLEYAPESLPSAITSKLSCYAKSYSDLFSETAIEILFAGLEPRSIATYQIVIRLPAMLPPDPVAISCEIPEARSQRFETILRVAR